MAQRNTGDSKPLATYLDLLPRDVLTALLLRCEYYRARNAAGLVRPACTLYSLLRETVRGLQICDTGCRYDGMDTLTLDTKSSKEDAELVLKHVGHNVQRLALYSARPDYSHRFISSIVLHCRQLDTIVIHWIRDGASLSAAHAFIVFVHDLLRALGDQVHRVVLADIAGIETEILDCIAENCDALHELILNGDVISKLSGLMSYERWGSIAKNVRVIQVNGFDSYSWYAPLFLRAVALNCRQLRTLRLDTCRIPTTLSQILTQLYLARGTMLKEATILNLAPELIRQLIQECPNLEKSTVLEEDPLFPRLHILGSTITELHLLMRDEYDSEVLCNAMKRCLTVERLHFTTIVPKSSVISLFCRMLPNLNLLSLHTYPDLITADTLSVIAAVTTNIRVLSLGRLHMQSLLAIEHIASANKHLRHVKISVSLYGGSMPIMSAACRCAAQLDKGLRYSSVLEEIIFNCEHDLSYVMKNRAELLSHAFRNSLRRGVQVQLGANYSI